MLTALGEAYPVLSALPLLSSSAAVGVGEESVNDLVWHPNGGRFLLFAPDGAASLWSPEDGLIAMADEDWEDSPRGVWMPDGDGWVSFGDDEWAYRHDAQGRGFRNLKAHARPISQVAFAPDGSAAVLASRDGLGSVWGSDLLPHRRPTVGPAVSYVSWSPTGDRFVASTASDKERDRDRRGVWIHEVATRRSVQVSEARSLRQARWSPRGDRIAWLDREQEEGGVWVAQVPKGPLPDGPLDATQLVLDEGDAPKSFAWSADGAFLVVGGNLGHGYIFHDTGKRRFRLPMGVTPFEIWHVEFSPDGTDVFMAGRVMSAVRVAADLSDVAVFNGHEYAVASIRPDPRGELVATSGADGTVRLWTYEGEQLAKFEEHKAEAKVLAWSPDGSRLASGDTSGTVIVRSREGEVVGRFGGVLGSADVLQWSSDSTRLAVAARDRRVWVLDRDGGLLIERQTRDTYAWQVAWSPDGTVLLGAGWGGPVYMWPGDDATTLEWARGLARAGAR